MTTTTLPVCTVCGEEAASRSAGINKYDPPLHRWGPTGHDFTPTMLRPCGHPLAWHGRHDEPTVECCKACEGVRR